MAKSIFRQLSATDEQFEAAAQNQFKNDIAAGILWFFSGFLFTFITLGTLSYLAGEGFSFSRLLALSTLAGLGAGLVIFAVERATSISAVKFWRRKRDEYRY